FVDDLRLRDDHLLAAVVAVGGDVVAQVGLARGRVGGQLLGGQGVMRAAHATAGRGNAGLLHSHGLAPASNSLMKTCKRANQSRFFSAASAANGLASCNSSAVAGHSRSSASLPGEIGTTGTARINSSSTSSAGRSAPSAGTGSGS